MSPFDPFGLEYSVECLRQEVRQSKPKPPSFRDEAFYAAFTARLVRGESAVDAAKGAEDDADAACQVRRDRKDKQASDFRRTMIRAREHGLIAAGWRKIAKDNLFGDTFFGDIFPSWINPDDASEVASTDGSVKASDVPAKAKRYTFDDACHEKSVSDLHGKKR